MHPITLQQLVAQHTNELHADAIEHRLIRDCRRGPTEPGAAPDRSLRNVIRGLLRKSKAKFDAVLQPSSRAG
jgi:hypothetical protein